MVGAPDLATPVFAAIPAYAFFGPDTLGEELEERFSRSQDEVAAPGLAGLGRQDISTRSRPVRKNMVQSPVRRHPCRMPKGALHACDMTTICSVGCR